MTSILNNQGAMVALATLAETNKNLLETQTQIATGKKVDSAAQNAAVWAVTTVMEADVDGFNSISDSLSLGKATVTVARNAAEKVTDLLREVKEKVVTAQGENVDRNKIQADIDELSQQVESIVNAAQFNGLNLIDGSTSSINVLSSLDRSSFGVTASNITVQAQDLSRSAGTFGAVGAATADYVEVGEHGSTNTTVANHVNTTDATQNFNLTDLAATGDDVSISIGTGYTFTRTAAFSNVAVDTWGQEFVDSLNVDLAANGLSNKFSVTYDAAADDLIVTNLEDFTEYAVTMSKTGGGTAIEGGTTSTQTLQESAAAITFEAEATQAIAAGTSYRLTLDDGGGTSNTYEYISRTGDTINDVTVAMAAIVNGDSTFNSQGLVAQANQAADVQTNQAQILLDIGSGAALDATMVVTTGGVAGGALATLSTMDVTTAAGAQSALDDIERLIQNSIDAASAFGSSEKRIDIQSEFVDSLVNSMKSGIGALVDTDMEEASARLQALQVQQQLGTQALSIANSGPQNILSLFR